MPHPKLYPYEKTFAELHETLIPYYRSWAHDRPMVLSRERDRELAELARVLHKACFYYAAHWREYLNFIDYEDKIKDILDYVADRPFHAGTYRPDYLILEDGSLKLCEITSRFFGNGYFLSFFMEHAGRVFAEEAKITDQVTYFEGFLAYMAALSAGKERLVVLKSADKSDSIRLYAPFYRQLGLAPVIVEAPEAEAFLPSVGNDLLVSALNQKDLLSYSADTLKRMADAGMRNDFRTIFLLHDKRFFHLFFEPSFTNACLTAEETDFLKAHTARTYLYGRQMEIWQDAREHKDGYILKHHCLGKSEKVFAGCLTAEEEWEELFASGGVKDMILQPFLRQRRFAGQWQGQTLQDYVSGTILTVDDRYFGTGLFRTSSRPVINQTDAHKIAQLVTDQWEKLPFCHRL